MPGCGSGAVVSSWSSPRSQHHAAVARKIHLSHLFSFPEPPLLTDGRIEIDNNTVERTIRPIALNRKNALFAGHDAGAENWAVIASLIETCKMNSIDPHAWLAATLTAIVNGHKQSQIDDLLPWNYASKV